MKKSAKPPRQLSLVKGLLAGVAGGLAGSAAKVVAEKLVPPRPRGELAPPRLWIERGAQAVGADLEDHTKQAVTQGIHWGFGTMVGGAYGVAAELSPRVTSWRGGVFGLTVNRVAHDQMLPRMGLSEPVPQQPAQERVSEWFTHVVYGLATEAVRRAVRKRL
ncbi:MAG TPA: DUF1440 domain-containing protein [Acidobacteriaceae bacterium]